MVTITAQMLSQVIPNDDATQQIVAMANAEWTREAIAMTTRKLRYLIIDPAFSEWTETIFDLYVDINEVTATLQELVDLGQPLQADVVTDVIAWAQEYNHLYEYDSGAHVPHRDSRMVKIAELVGVGPDDLLGL